MVNKKAYLRTVEAIIAIIIIVIVSFTLIPRHRIPTPKTPFNVKSSQDFILNEILTNKVLRACVLHDPGCETNNQFKSLFEKNIPMAYNYTYKICDKTNCVVTTPTDKSIYMNDIIIAPDDIGDKPKIVRLWVWEK
jgi:hypothetical protein